MPRSEKFKSAFDRFENWAKSNGIKLQGRPYPEIKRLFEFWGGHHVPMTQNQDSALKAETSARHIGFINVEHREKGNYNQYRNVGTGRFISKAEAETYLDHR